MIHKACNSAGLKIVPRSLRVHLLHLISIISFKLGHVSIPKRPIFSPLFLFCAYDSSVLKNFKIFTHLLPNFRIGPSDDGSDVPLNSECITSTIGSGKLQTFIILAQYFEIMTRRKRNYQFTDISVFLIAC